MVYPRDGMDTLFEDGFGAALGDRVMRNAPVTEIRQDADQVRVIYTDLETGESAEATADYCVCNAPLSVLMKMRLDISGSMRDAIAGVPYFMSMRMGLAFNRRFWEEDDWIYGGQSYFNVPEINILHYPDVNYHAEGGVVLGLYNFGTVSARVTGMSNEDRIELALDYGSRMHPTYRDDFHSGVSVAWHRMPYALGAWPDFSPSNRAAFYPTLLEPDGRLYLVGEHLSYVNGWIEGAFQGAWYQVEQLHSRVMQGG
jgi:monoamine oxidase